jgi:hypothetical protein
MEMIKMLSKENITLEVDKKSYEDKINIMQIDMEHIIEKHTNQVNILRVNVAQANEAYHALENQLIEARNVRLDSRNDLYLCVFYFIIYFTGK